MALEFTAMVGIAMVLFVAMSYFAYSLIALKTNDRTFATLRDIGYVVQDEFILAAEVEPGYQRQFIIPNEMNGEGVGVTGDGTNIEITYNGQVLTLSVPSYSGSISTGINSIRMDAEGNLHVT